MNALQKKKKLTATSLKILIYLMVQDIYYIHVSTKYFSLNFFKLASSSLNFNNENATVKFDGKMVKFNNENQKDIFFISFDDLRDIVDMEI